MTPDIDDFSLHDLANMPGAGNAARRLRAAGFPMDASDEGDSFTVSVDYSIGYTEQIEVKAFSRDDAIRKAREAVKDFPGGGVQECVEIYTADIVKGPKP